jgi:hypothetical protein
MEPRSTLAPILERLDKVVALAKKLNADAWQLVAIVGKTYIYTYIPLTLYSRRGSRGISNIPPRNPRFTKIS